MGNGERMTTNGVVIRTSRPSPFLPTLSGSPLRSVGRRFFVVADAESPPLDATTDLCETRIDL